MQPNTPFFVSDFQFLFTKKLTATLAWVLSDYVSEVLDLSSPDVFRE
jgi:hypothetical protein